MTQTQVSLTLDIPSLAGVTLEVESVVGREAISEPFSFEIRCVSASEVDPLSVIGQKATFKATVGDDEFELAGVVAAFAFKDPTAAGEAVYVVTLAPRLWLLDLSRQNQIYGTQSATTLPDLVDAVVTNRYGATSNTGGHGQTIPMALRLQSSYPPRTHVVQYEESDLTFLSRLCEHDGVFYFFEHGDAGDTVVFGDSNLAFTQANLPDEARVPYRRKRQGYRVGEPAISSFCGLAQPVAGKLYLRDYNEETPQMQLFVETDVEGAGPGVVVEHGANFDSVERGRTLATLRAEEMACRRYVFSGEATTPQLRPGTYFTLSDHPAMSLEGRYLVVSAEHRAVSPNAPGFTGGEAARAYSNAITCIRFDTTFRPPRTTPSPRLGGVFTATVDAEGDGSRAEVDAQGRYKVRLAYDEANAPAGKASAEIRRAQPYAGKGDSGMHFPLLKSTEVAVSYLNGDPDRPVILGALANPQTPDVVTQDLLSYNRIRTTSGISLEMNDGLVAAATQAASQSAASNVPQPAMAEGPEAATRLRSGAGRAIPATAGLSAAGLAPSGLPPTPHGEAGGGGGSETTQIMLRMDVPQTAGGQPRSGNYIRLGTYNPDEESEIVPKLPYYTSTATTESQDPKEAAEKSGKQTQNKNTYSAVTATAHDSSYNGMLVYTADDYNATIAGASMSKYGKGYTTETTSGDSNHQVLDGQFALFAKNGVALTAGSGSGSSPAADIKLTASNYIKQTAYGPLSEATYGDSHKVTYGDSYDEFHGTKTSYFYGDEITYKIAGTQQYYINALFAAKLSVELTIALALVTKMSLIGDVKIAAGQDTKIIAGLNMTLVAGLDFKSVAGTTVKMTGTDVKITGTDSKVAAGADTKMVLADIKFCEVKFEACFSDIKSKPYTATDEDIATDFAAIKARQESMSSTIAGLWSVM